MGRGVRGVHGSADVQKLSRGCPGPGSQAPVSLTGWRPASPSASCLVNPGAFWILFCKRTGSPSFPREPHNFKIRPKGPLLGLARHGYSPRGARAHSCHRATSSRAFLHRCLAGLRPAGCPHGPTPGQACARRSPGSEEEGAPRAVKPQVSLIRWSSDRAESRVTPLSSRS